MWFSEGGGGSEGKLYKFISHPTKIIETIAHPNLPTKISEPFQMCDIH